MENNNSKALTSLALMETNLLASDYLSTFIPFIASLTLKKGYETIDIAVLVQDFKEEFGIGIPHAPMKSVLSKAVSQGLIEYKQDGRYYPVKSEMLKVSFASKTKASQSEIDSIVSGFIDFSKENHNIDFTKEEAIDALVKFLDKYSPVAISGDYFENTPTVSCKDLYLIGEFIQRSAINNPTIFEIITKLSMAYLIAIALSFDEPVEGRLNEFNNVTLYLDTPIVLRLLGLQTKELEQSYKEMFDTFKGFLNADFKVFQHTFDEISGIIADCSNWIDNPSYNPQYANPALLNFVKNKYTKMEVDLYQSNLETKLNDIGISVDEIDYYDFINKGEQIDSKILENRLVEIYKNHNPNFDENKNATSIKHDIHSIENIVKLWGRKSTKTYSNLGYIFITSNSTLAYVCRKYTCDYWWDTKNHKSPCITDYYLGTMVWLSTPADKIANVSKLKLLADCSAATTLSREIMEKYVYALEKLKKDKGIKNQDFLLLRRFAFEKNYLQNLTLNEENAFKDNIIEELLEQIKLDLQKPLINEIDEKNQEIANLLLDRKEKERFIEELQSEKANENSKKEVELTIDRDNASKLTQHIINSIIPIITAIMMFISGILQIVPLFSTWNPIIKIVSLIISLLSALILGLLKANVMHLKDKLESRLLRYYKIKRYKNSL